MFETIWAVLVALASIAMILIVLVQSGKKAGLSGAIAGGSDSYMSKSKSGDLDQVLANATKWVALVWIALVLVMNLM